ncbi:AAA family ATPase [Pseudokineococcus lusitanus]|uniref:MoxR-like ATPase n=1 Tax=Pseudokineococcus lusitanus TaxID=763993 RepID=A0A3N1HK28_9ACTN|nr:AAA family ATPase [Pseudokineococcus lusitanus]ROP42856.1 MoxR-like ATPase [Pseudokineococcus lusitanus]
MPTAEPDPTGPPPAVAPAVPPAGSPGDRTTDDLAHAVAEARRVVVGQRQMVERVVVAVLARGHVLLEGVPGTAKTLAARTLATVLGGSFARVQFTPDLVPSDIVGTRIWSPATERFSVELGPVFTNVVLADEVNRAPAKVQAAMLELMGERQVSLAGTTHAVPAPFTVIATQNPVESEGVYPLPEAQRDRFLLQVVVPLPGAADEAEILRRMSVDPPRAHAVLDPERVLALQAAADAVYVHPLVTDYVVRLVMATRQPAAYGAPDVAPLLEAGASPRASLGLLAAARALALVRGRDHVLPDDVRELAVEVVAHRLVLSLDALADGVEAADVVARLVAAVPPPVPTGGPGEGAGGRDRPGAGG